MYSERTSSEIFVSKWLSDVFPVQNFVKQESGLYSHLGCHCFHFGLECSIREVQKKKKTVVGRIEWHILGSGVC
jgi:hypothetical protein